jgi:hypothetical protein
MVMLVLGQVLELLARVLALETLVWAEVLVVQVLAIVVVSSVNFWAHFNQQY